MDYLDTVHGCWLDYKSDLLFEVLREVKESEVI